MDLGAPAWLIDLLSGINLWTLIICVTVLVGGVVFIRKKGWPWLTAFARGILNAAEILVAVQGLPAFITRADASLEEHTRQLKNSHNTNLREELTAALDGVTRVEASVKGLHGRLDTVEADVKALRTTTEDLAAIDEELRAEIENTQPISKED